MKTVIVLQKKFSKSELKHQDWSKGYKRDKENYVLNVISNKGLIISWRMAGSDKISKQDTPIYKTQRKRSFIICPP
jgi:hypothetical protein